MSVFSNIGKSISNKGKEISKKAKVMSETSSLNNIIKGEECKIDTQYKMIGKMYFEKYSSSPEQEFEPAIEAIKNSMEKITETKQEIIKIRSQFCCPQCGAAFKNDALFCSKCGAKLPEKPKPQPSVPQQTKKCANCGNILESDALFCNVCGTKFEDTYTETPAALPDENGVQSSPEENTAPAEAVMDTNTPEEISAPTENNTADSNTETENSSASESIDNAAAPSPAESSVPEKLFCPNCKSEIQPEDIFCNECGTKIK